MNNSQLDSDEQWIACRQQMPPEGVRVKTQIDDSKGVRNEQIMYFLRGLWWIGSDKDAMYVYYSPTHWHLPPPTIRRDDTADTEGEELNEHG